MRGKDEIFKAADEMEEGSPPLARERPAVQLTVAIHVGITPACAGKTYRPYINLTEAGDHPRLRGKD